MLTHIHIRDFALVDRLELELSAGMTVLTGETGAGKSILLDALQLALGDRADPDVVRHGGERADVSVTFDIAGLPQVAAWLRERELEAGDECLLRRTVGRDGRSRGFINGQPAPLQTLRELGEQLVDIHGQHDHQSLLKRDQQRQTLDDYAGHGALLDALAGGYRQWKILHQELDELRHAQASRAARLDLLRYQVQELQQLALGADELPQLEERHHRLANASRLVEGAQRALGQLDDDEQAVLAALGQLTGQVSVLRDIDPRLNDAATLLDDAQIQLTEAARALRHYLDGLDLDPAQLRDVEQRLSAVYDLARKHHVPAAALPALTQQLAEELDTLENADERSASLEQNIAAAAAEYRRSAGQLSASRARAAQALGKQVTQNMQRLNMRGGKFAVQLEPVAPEAFSAAGLEQVEFMVSANPGQPLKPLAKVASGGELSRISLALAVVIASTHRIPTLIFDEVDVGIGGGTAEVVGQLLRALGEKRQVLCVTHQPQVAAQAHQHLQVEKLTRGGTTVTRLNPLAADQRIAEIARMLGGLEITSQTLSHAKEMLALAQGVAAT